MSENGCPRVKLLDDSPVKRDLFGGHKRVAHAIADLIRTEAGGKAIAIEGTWGSGKSSVVQMVDDALPEDSLVFTFDAWAHEGDPLRIVFLEQLVNRFEQEGWLTKKQWKQWQDRLDQIRHKTETRKRLDVPILRLPGIIAAVFLLFTPVALILFSALASAVDGPIPRVYYLLLLVPLLLALSPLLDVGAARKWENKKEEDEDPRRPLTSFIIGRTFGESVSTTRGEGDTTSREFEIDFSKLMSQGLKGETERRFLIVIDNLDRLDPADSLRVWSTMRVFCEGRATGEQWRKRHWLIVPFDRDSIVRLWRPKGDSTPSASHEDTDDETPSSETTARHDTALSFLDKTFVARFDVPPLLLTDWRDALLNWLKEALGDHQDEEELEIVYRLSLDFSEDHRHPPTPRHLKLFVNDIGALVRQHGDEFRLRALAAYAILRRSGLSPEDIRYKLREGKLSEHVKVDVLDERGSTELACLVFNTHDKDQALELLLRRPLAAALRRGDVEAAERLGHSSAFRPTLDILYRSIPSDVGTDQAFSTNALEVLAATRWHESCPESQARLVRTIAKTILANATIEQLDANTAQFLINGLRVGGDTETTKLAVDKLQSQLVTVENSVLWAAALTSLTDAVKQAKMEEHLPRQIKLGGEPSAIVALLRALVANSRFDDQLCARLGVRDKTNVPGDEFWPSVDAHPWSEENAEIVRRIMSSQIPFDAQGFSERCGEVLAEPDKRTADHILRVLAILKSVQEKKKAPVQEQLKMAADQGWIHHHLMHAFEDEAWDAAADLVSEICTQRSLKGEPTAFHRAHEAHGKLQEWLADETALPELDGALLESSQRERLRRFVELRLQFDDAPDLVKRLLAKVEPHDDYALIVPSKLLVSAWPKIEALCGEDDSGKELRLSIVKENLDKDSLISIVVAEGFSEARIELYRDMVEGGAMSVKSFSDFVSASLRGRDEDAWVRTINGETTLEFLLWEARDVRPDIKLEKPYQSALEGYGKALMEGVGEVVYDAEDAPSVLEGLGDALRHVLTKTFRDVLHMPGKVPRKEFIALFGDDLAELMGATPKPDDLRLIVCRALEGSEVETAEFAALVLETKPAVYKTAPKEDKTALRATIKEFIATKKDGPLGDVMRRAAKVLKIKWPEKTSEAEDDSSEPKHSP